MQRQAGVERFVQYVVGGGLALVAGLWLLRLLEPRTLPWIAGAALVLLGIAGLAAGIYREIEV